MKGQSWDHSPYCFSSDPSSLLEKSFRLGFALQASLLRRMLEGYQALIRAALQLGRKHLSV